MLHIRPLWNSLLLFAFPIFIGQLTVPWLSTPMTHRLLEQKVNEIETAMAERNRELDTALSHQLAQFAFDCGAKDMALLRDPSVYSTHIRLQGLELASGVSCSSVGPGIPLLHNVNQDAPLAGKYGLTATAAKFNTEQELVAYAKAGENIAYWVLDNSWSHQLLQNPCSNCFYLEFTPLNEGMTPTRFPRGNQAIKNDDISYSQSFFDPDRMTKLTVWAGQALEQFAQEQVRSYALWIGTSLGLVMVALYGLLHSYRRSLKGEIQTGLAHREFIPFYQPIVDTRSYAVVGFEALLRWRRGGELIPPGLFIDYAEEQGLILPMTEQLLEQVIRDLPQLAPEQWVSVNLVAAHIERPLLRNLLNDLLPVCSARLTFELTERKPILDIKAAINEITLLQQMGYHFKLDDFGTGYGGFAYLQSLGIRQIKIDKMFVDTIGTGDLKRSVLDAIIAFGRESGMQMIAEGVETQEQVEYLHQQGVDQIHGYVFGKPMSLADLQQWQHTFRHEEYDLHPVTK
ncbi:EAL domain-containing protein [Aeromonas allosaccharophila]|uniref:EAL domain-containing protein n=1 Tax=Aeromonas allosaccharophila TaxID=656 RepID=A0AAX3NQL4_9GAMM|nr:EAL domain-containing protein [Aeromonas allosaccharophila]WED76406.1 EAL domain-containing protein [Aeromonas allosaccharophila]